MTKQKLFFITASLVWLGTVLFSLITLFSQGIAFWYDPARDLLTATNNLTKLTLIGPPSGIPGIFYGPYWIWDLSFALLFSKNPVVVTLLTTTLPYLLFFPFVLFFFAKMFGKLSVLLLWILFFLSSQRYILLLWNPNLAPLLFLGAISLLVFVSSKSRKSWLFYGVAGILTGLALNIHLSFSTGFTFGCIFFLLLTPFLQKKAAKQKIQEVIVSLLVFFAGIAVIFIPFFLFEVRHGFQQIHTALAAFAKGGGVVTLHGLTKQQIFITFFDKITVLLSLNNILVLIGIALLILFLAVQAFRKKIVFMQQEKRLLLLLILICICTLGLYLSAKNPIWDYHFIGVEIIFLLFFGVLLAKIKYLRYILLIWVIILSFQQTKALVLATQKNSLQNGTLYTKEFIVKTIQQDAKNRPYTVYVYSSSIYMYDYAYLFQWLAHKDVPYDPGQIRRVGDVYLILPTEKQSVLADFISFRTPSKTYKTVKSWRMPDSTVILKRSPL